MQALILGDEYGMNRINFRAFAGSIVVVLTVIAVVTIYIVSTNDVENIDYPRVLFTKVEERHDTSFYVHAGGYSYRPVGRADLKESDFSICFDVDSTMTRYESRILTAAPTTMVSFSVRFSNRISGIQVLRWPFDKYGTDNPLDEAERVAYEEKSGECTFVAEAGYLYSVYITWEYCFIEYPFQVVNQGSRFLSFEQYSDNGYIR